ncbi:Piso0_002445 [Millerozyma farinosa CBS 7064]|uniref:Piso0_002445 protein n=1 Tax=Pichia sorbitophila (strain ATCC MYA-4447 / BCRC 22081 / CBS 7064 / NBRC 10061 / NRRL Y-12695) TaxID=559304 RepID=G8YF24_PICSO|nr:Piso0_002445 [Millerozyma farinosa CBS 7064]
MLETHLVIRKAKETGNNAATFVQESDNTVEMEGKHIHFDKIDTHQNSLCGQLSRGENGGPNATRCFLMIDFQGVAQRETIGAAIADWERLGKAAQVEVFETNGNEVDDVFGRSHTKAVSWGLVESRLAKKPLAECRDRLVKLAASQRCKVQGKSKVFVFSGEGSKDIYVDVACDTSLERKWSSLKRDCERDSAFLTEISRRARSPESSYSDYITSLVIRNQRFSKFTIIVSLSSTEEKKLVKSALNVTASLSKSFNFLYNLRMMEKDKTGNVPRYAKPTLAFMSPQKDMAKTAFPKRTITPRSKASKLDTHVNPKSASSTRTSKGLNMFLSPSKSSPLTKEKAFASSPIVKAQNITKLDKNVPLFEKPASKPGYFSPDTKRSSPNNALMKEFTEFKVEKELEIRSLKTQIRELEHLKTQSSEMEEKKTLLMEKVEELAKEFVTFKEEHCSFIDSVSELKGTISHLENEKQKVEARKSEIEKELELMYSKQFEDSHNAELLKDQNESLSKANNELKNQVGALKDQILLADNAVTEKSKEVESIQKKQMELEANNALAKELQEEVSMLRIASKESDEQKTVLEEKMNVLLDEKATLNDTISSLKETVESNQGLTEQISRLGEEKKALEEEVSLHKESEEKLTKLISTQKEEIESLINNKSEAPLESGAKDSEEKTQLRETIESLKNNNEELKEQLSKAMSEASNYKLKLRMQSKMQKNKGESNENHGSSMKPNVLQPSNVSSLDNKQNRIAKLSKKLNKKKKKSIGGYEIKSATN